MRKGGFLPLQLLKVWWGVFKGVLVFIICLPVLTRKHGGTGDVLWYWDTNSLCWNSLQSSGRGNDSRVFQPSLESSAAAFHIGPHQTKCFPEVFSPHASRVGKNLAHWHQWGLVQRCHLVLSKQNKKHKWKRIGDENKQTKNLEWVLFGEIKGVKIESHFLLNYKYFPYKVIK